jgi:hypothetical protein
MFTAGREQLHGLVLTTFRSIAAEIATLYYDIRLYCTPTTDIAAGGGIELTDLRDW